MKRQKNSVVSTYSSSAHYWAARIRQHTPPFILISNYYYYYYYFHKTHSNTRGSSCNRLVGFNTLHVYLYTRAYLQTYFYIESLGCALRPLCSQRVQIPVRKRRRNTVTIVYRKKFVCLVNVFVSTMVNRIRFPIVVNIIHHKHQVIRPRSGSITFCVSFARKCNQIDFDIF